MPPIVPRSGPKFSRGTYDVIARPTLSPTALTRLSFVSTVLLIQLLENLVENVYAVVRRSCAETAEHIR